MSYLSSYNIGAKSKKPTYVYGVLQDGNGGIWSYSVSPNKKTSVSVQLYTCHAGPVMDLVTSPINEHFTTLGKDGRLFVYNYFDKKIVAVKKFEAEGNCLIWLPLHVSLTLIFIILFNSLSAMRRSGWLAFIPCKMPGTLVTYFV